MFLCAAAAAPPARSSGRGVHMHAARAWVAAHRQAQNCAIAVRDFYHFWKSRNEHSRAGKLLLVDPLDTAVVQMFFDDNIGFSKAHIVDARNAWTGESIPFEQCRASYLTRSEPVNAILDPKYFVRCAAMHAVSPRAHACLRRAAERALRRSHARHVRACICAVR
jgi:hypothetical protein